MLTSMFAVQDKCIWKPAVALALGDTTVWTVSGGPIQIITIGMLCTSLNNANASTIQWAADGTDGAAATITGASASLANAAAGTLVASVPGTLATAPAVYANGVGIAGTVGIIVPAGIIKATVGTAAITGLWRQFILYRPLTPDSVING